MFSFVEISVNDLGVLLKNGMNLHFQHKMQKNSLETIGTSSSKKASL